jgi:hypothetical protein
MLVMYGLHDESGERKSYTVKQAAHELEISVYKVQKLMKAGVTTCTGGVTDAYGQHRRRRISMGALRRYLETVLASMLHPVRSFAQ